MKTVSEFGGFQGDVDIVRLDDLPADAKPTERRIVAYGEATGHNHTVVGECDAYEVSDGLVFVVAPETEVQMVHTADHDPEVITPGIWFVPFDSQVEYDGENERKVMD